MLGMTDFSMIPSYFIDDASLLHGTSSVSETGGGLGGLVKLSTAPAAADGFGLQYIQGIGMFRTFDEFLRLTWGDERWQVSTRAVYQSSANDYKYRNRDKKENIYDDEMNIVGSYYPTERNKSGAFDDVHVLQEVYYNTGKGDRFGLNAWYINSNRELPLLTTDYADDTQFENRQREHTLRSVLSWDHYRRNWKAAAKAGYVHSWTAYDYRRDKGNGILEAMTRSRSRINTLYGQADGEYSVGGKWFFTAGLSAHQHFVESADKNIIRQQGDKAVVGYDKGRIELDGSLSAKWRPTERLGLSIVVREAMYGTSWSPVIPAFFADCLLSRRGNVVAKASVSRNYRFPTLNDHFSWTPSINNGDPVDWYDKAIGKQLVYIPEYSASVTGRLTYRSWRFIYKWCYYSERFTTSDNSMKTKIGRVKPYFMSDVSLEKAFSLRWADFTVKGVVNNLFNEEYESVLSRPMPRLNYELFLDIRPRWGRRR